MNIELDWRLRGPDSNDRVWLDRVELDDLDLGPTDSVRKRLSGFCASAAAGRMEMDGATLDWDLEGPDAGGVVTLLWNGDEAQNFRLGHVDPVCSEFQRWIGGLEASA